MANQTDAALRRLVEKLARLQHPRYDGFGGVWMVCEGCQAHSAVGRSLYPQDHHDECVVGQAQAALAESEPKETNDA